MRQCIDNRLTVKQSDFTSTTDEQKYKLGEVIKVEDQSSDISEEWIYVQATNPVLKGVPQSVVQNGEVATITTVAINAQCVVIPQFDFAAGEYGFMQYKGACEALTSTAAVVNNYIKSSATEVELDVAYSIKSLGYYAEAKIGVNEELISIVLFGKDVQAI